MENFYTNELKDYNSNYNDAISIVETIVSSLKNLYDSFTGAQGNDIERIRNDITTIQSDLNRMKQTINDKKDTTNMKAANCDNVYETIKNQAPTPTFFNEHYAFEFAGNRKVYIKDGIIYLEENFRQIPIEHYNGLFGAVAAVGKMFNAYKIINTTVRQSVDSDSMMKGVVKFEGVYKPQ